jgi:hypothetical protein
MNDCPSNLLILSCSATKVTSRGALPALELYDGPVFRVLRRFLVDHGWPSSLLIKIVSAKHGLIDATDLIHPYDLRMTRAMALRMRAQATRQLRCLVPIGSALVNLGSDYMPVVEDIGRLFGKQRVQYAGGGIGQKMKAMRLWLEQVSTPTAGLPRLSAQQKHYLYFFPDWDDYIYTPFTPVEKDELKSSGRLRKAYAHDVFGRGTPYDGLLVSLAQLKTSKGALGRNEFADGPTTSLRQELHLPDELILFGDCGAFSYAGEARPPFTAVEAAELYDKYGFDVGASVDHIPLPEVVERDAEGGKTKRTLSRSTQQRRLQLTKENAEEFLGVCRKRQYPFVPMGVVQGIGVRSYVNCVQDYLDMGYQHIAIGGLVPRSDQEILEIVCAVRRVLQQHCRRGDTGVWLHLFGILRPKLQASFRSLGVSSFDSASYLRKAWLRSDQNYLDPDGTRWYASMRVPIASSARMRAVGEAVGSERLAGLEQCCLSSLEMFDGSPESTEAILKSLADYGPLLERKGEENHFAEKYAALLRDRPWQRCRCAVCREAGIDVVVFRGANRNKRRGLHNTWVLYHRILHGRSIPTSSQG